MTESHCFTRLMNAAMLHIPFLERAFFMHEALQFDQIKKQKKLLIFALQQ